MITKKSGIKFKQDPITSRNNLSDLPSKPTSMSRLGAATVVLARM